MKIKKSKFDALTVIVWSSASVFGLAMFLVFVLVLIDNIPEARYTAKIAFGGLVVLAVSVVTGILFPQDND